MGQKRKWKGKHGSHGQKKPRYSKVSDEESKENILQSLPILKSKIDDYGPLKQNAALEKELGIEEFLSPGAGFQGLVKKRYEDFIVQEINVTGTVGKLTNEDALSDAEPAEIAEFGEEDIKAFTELATQAEAEKLSHFFLNSKRGDKKARMLLPLCRPGDTVLFQGEKFEIVSVNRDNCALKKEGKNVTAIFEQIFPKFAEEALKKFKARRTAVHNWLNRRFPKCTHKTDNFGRIEISRKIQRPRDKRWPKDKPPILKFIMEKKGMSTHRALQLLAQGLRTNQKEFGFAGNKDKRGWTTQWVTANRVNSLRVKNASAQVNGVSTGNYEYCPKETRLGLGSCKGNRFLLSIRDLQGEPSQISAALAHVREYGFINYFGTQRFGVSSIGTHELGKFVLKKDWGMVIALLLCEQPGFNDNAKEDIREFWKTGDCRQVKSRSFGMGAAVARSLGVHPGQFQTVVNSIVRTQRNLMVHAYQSYIWNQVASERIRRHGLNVVADDLLLIGKKQVEPVGEERISQFNIEDIVLPVPGFKMTYPAGLKELYEQLVKKDGMDLNDNFVYDSQGWDTSGDYRNLIRKPESLMWDVVHYSDENDSFVEPYLRDEKTLSSPESFEVKHRTALLLAFNLPKSSYATMVVREVMKIETTKESLMKQNQQQEQKDAASKSEDLGGVE